MTLKRPLGLGIYPTPIAVVVGHYQHLLHDKKRFDYYHFTSLPGILLRKAWTVIKQSPQSRHRHPMLKSFIGGRTFSMATLGKPKIKLFVDTVSPFGYEAYYILRHDPVFSKVEIEYFPIFLGGLMKACNNAAPISIKNKAEWIGTERLRWAKLFDIPMKEQIPPSFPPMTLTIMRSLCALTILHDGKGKEGQEKLIKCLDRLYEEYWVKHRKTYEKDVLAEVLTEVLGKEEAGKILEMTPKEGKALLSKNTDQAFAEGAFGLPWFQATNSKGETEGFWGVDHIGQVTAFLGLEMPKKGGWKCVL